MSEDRPSYFTFHSGMLVDFLHFVSILLFISSLNSYVCGRTHQPCFMSDSSGDMLAMKDQKVETLADDLFQSFKKSSMVGFVVGSVANWSLPN